MPVQRSKRDHLSLTTCATVKKKKKIYDEVQEVETIPERSSIIIQGNARMYYYSYAALQHCALHLKAEQSIAEGKKKLDNMSSNSGTGDTFIFCMASQRGS